MNKSGQALIAAVVMLPVIILTTSLVYKSSATALNQNMIQTSIDHKALKILAIQAKGLEAIGRLNPTAEQIINARRHVDKLIAASVAAPALAAQLIRIRMQLLSFQKIIASKQALINEFVTTLCMKESKQLVNNRFSKVTTTQFWPSTFKLHVQKKADYKTEIGAPHELSSDFNEKQFIKIKAALKTEDALFYIRDANSFKNIKINSYAKVEMKTLEGPWEVRLRTSPDKAL